MNNHGKGIFVIVSMFSILSIFSCSNPVAPPEPGPLNNLVPFTVDVSKLTDVGAYLYLQNSSDAPLPLPSLWSKTGVNEGTTRSLSPVQSSNSFADGQGDWTPTSDHLLDTRYLHGYSSSRAVSAPEHDKVLTDDAKADEVGTTTVFSVYPNFTDAQTVKSTSRWVSTVDTAFGQKKLSIHVSNDLWDVSKKITQAMVEYYGQAFLKVGPNNDIYDWVTFLLGEEYGDSLRYDGQIPVSDTITILITDLGDTGLVGYFTAENNYAKKDSTGANSSNERIMFVLNGAWLTNTDTAWEEDSFRSQVFLSTLVHEFQHMIQYYQREIVIDRGAYEVWLNELMSMALEDALADKLGNNGTLGYRNLDGTALEYQQDITKYSTGAWSNRVRDYMLFGPELSLFRWVTPTEVVQPYYASNSLVGSYLLRKHGGPDILRKLMNCIPKNVTPFTSAYSLGALQEVTGMNMVTLLGDFSKSLLNSSAISNDGLNQGRWHEFSVPSVIEGGEALSLRLSSLNVWNYPQSRTSYWKRNALDPRGLELTKYYAENQGYVKKTIQQRNTTLVMPPHSWALIQLRTPMLETVGYSDQTFNFDLSPTLQAELQYLDLPYW